MSKARILIFSIIFLTGTALGILIYSNLRAKTRNPVSTDLPNPTTESAQLNYYILRVDDLGKASPRLTSVWVALIFPADYSTLILKSLYPPVVANPDTSQPYHLRIDKDGNPTAEFWQSFDQLPLRRNGFLLIDDVALRSISEYITGSVMTFTPLPDDPALRNELILTEEHLLWQDTCLAIQSKRNERGPALYWSDLIPAHFRTDIGFEQVMMLWDKFSRQSDTLHCEILITP